MENGYHSEPMDNVDRAWLGMDSETNLMIINGVLMFDELIDFSRFRSLFQERLVGQFARFGQRLVERPRGSGRYYWVTDPYFDIRAHVHRLALPAPGDKQMLQSLVSDLMNSDFDKNKPLWTVYLIEGYGEGCAVFARFHHCIADGIALIRVMLSLTDEAAEGKEQTVKPRYASSDDPRRSALFKPFRPLLNLSRTTINQTGRLGAMTLRQILSTLDDPAGFIEMAKSVGILSAAGAATLTRLIILPPDRTSIYQGKLGTVKQTVWSEPIPLPEVKRIGKSLGGTVNDVLIAALTGALRVHMAEKGDDPDRGDLRAMVPVNLRPLDQAIELGNRFGLVYLTLPVSLADPMQRLYEVKRRMDILKSSPEAILAYQVLNGLGVLPGDLAVRATDMFAGKASAVLTNVPGPRTTRYFAGAPLRRMMFWVPQSGDIGVGLSIISYNDEVCLGIVIDEKLIANPNQILVAFQREFEMLSRLADKYNAAKETVYQNVMSLSIDDE
ncbi:MAG: wax ester/triacylglycerol synthase family O-acyltransferase [Caldilineaceae bacterium]|nr:wax ester/triacylglycerol synthase family O-acyltransferase [Caldilineaceae bacterium]